MDKRFTDFYMDLAARTALLSRARRLQVGAILVKEDRVISLGFNGTPSGWDNNCEDNDYMDRGAGGWLGPEEIYERWPLTETIVVANDNESREILRRYCLKTKPEVLHAEANCIAKVARSSESSEGAVLFSTHAPCMECAKLIYQSGIKQVFYRDEYRNDAGPAFLTQAGIAVVKLVDINTNNSV